MTAPDELRVLHCDNHLLVVVKPAGMPSVPDASGDPSAFDLARDWVQREFDKPGAAFLGVVHRLDRPVSGVLAFARTSKAAARLSLQLREHEAGKVYWAVGEGARDGAPAEGELEEWLLKDPDRNVVTAVRATTPGSKRAVTIWRVLARTAEHTLYELCPRTGRPHQLRHAARTLGTPLSGDLKYGAREGLGASIGLHAAALRLRHPTRDSELVFTCAPPRTRPWTIAAFVDVLERRGRELSERGAIE